jgi:hypothetical protein
VFHGVCWHRDQLSVRQQDEVHMSANLEVALKLALQRIQGQNEAFSRLEAKASGFLTLVSAALAAEAGLFAAWRSEKWFSSPLVGLVVFSLVLVGFSIIALVVCLSIRDWYDTPKWSDFLDRANLHDEPQEYLLGRLTKVKTAVERNDNMLGTKAIWFQASLFMYAGGIFLFLLPVVVKLSAGLR